MYKYFIKNTVRKLQKVTIFLDGNSDEMDGHLME